MAWLVDPRHSPAFSESSLTKGPSIRISVGARISAMRVDQLPPQTANYRQRQSVTYWAGKIGRTWNRVEGSDGHEKIGEHKGQRNLMTTATFICQPPIEFKYSTDRSITFAWHNSGAHQQTRVTSPRRASCAIRLSSIYASFLRLICSHNQWSDFFQWQHQALQLAADRRARDLRDLRRQARSFASSRRRGLDPWLVKSDLNVHR